MGPRKREIGHETRTGRPIAGTLSVALVLSLSLAGCSNGPHKPRGSTSAEKGRVAALRERAKELAERAGEAAPEVQISQGAFTARDAAGRIVLQAQAKSWQATVSSERGVEGPVTLEQVSSTLYQDGRPSLWLKAPRAVWENGVLRALNGVQGGAVDRRFTCMGETAEWVARTNRLTVRPARCDAQEAGRPALHAEGPVAQWQNGLLTMPAGVDARSADGQSTLRARHLTWTAASARLVATGDVVATRGGSRMRGETLVADTRLRHVQMRGAVPRPSRQLASRGMPIGGVRPVLYAAPAAGAKPGRVTFDLPSGWTGEADTFSANYSVQPVEFEASGRVVLRGPRGSINAPRVTGQYDNKRGLLVARASGGVRLETAPENGRSMVARGQDAVYEPPRDQVTLTGGAEATMTSPQLAEPAHLVGDRVVAHLRSRTATVYRTQAARVQLTLRPKQEPEPFELTADQLTYDGSSDRVTATGRPVMKNARGTLTADRIVFDLVPGGTPPGTTANPLRVARAVGNVVVDATWQEPNAQTLHATGREAVYTRARNEITLTGDVQGTMSTPDSPKPNAFTADRLTVDLQTRHLTMNGAPAQVRTVPPARRSPAATPPAGRGTGRRQP